MKGVNINMDIASFLSDSLAFLRKLWLVAIGLGWLRVVIFLAGGVWNSRRFRRIQGKLRYHELLTRGETRFLLDKLAREWTVLLPVIRKCMEAIDAGAEIIELVPGKHFRGVGKQGRIQEFTIPTADNDWPLRDEEVNKLLHAAMIGYSRHTLQYPIRKTGLETIMVFPRGYIPDGGILLLTDQMQGLAVEDFKTYQRWTPRGKEHSCTCALPARLIPFVRMTTREKVYDHFHPLVETIPLHGLPAVEMVRNEILRHRLAVNCIFEHKFFMLMIDVNGMIFAKTPEDVATIHGADTLRKFIGLHYGADEAKKIFGEIDDQEILWDHALKDLKKTLNIDISVR